MNARIVFTCALVALAANVTHAGIDDLIKVERLDYTGVTHRQKVRMYIDNTDVFGSQVYAGIYNFKTVSPTLPEGAKYETFCADPDLLSEPDFFGFVNPAAGNVPQDLEGTVSPMTEDQENALERIWYHVLGSDTPSQTLTNSTLAAAFQLVVWEIAWANNDGTVEYGDIDSGWVHAATGEQDTLDQAQAWLDWVADNPNAPYIDLTGLATVSTDTDPVDLADLEAWEFKAEGQDQAYVNPDAVIVPLPAAAWPGMALLGFLGVGKLRRKQLV